MLRDLGHRVRIGQEYRRGACDALIAVHAFRSAPAIECYRERHPDGPLIVLLAGTDVYQPGGLRPETQRSLELADAVIALQPRALDLLPDNVRAKTRVIYQSVEPSTSRARRPRATGATFDVCVLGNLRPVKDPFLTATAARMLPDASRIRVVHVGAALDADMEDRALREQRENDRYTWERGQTPARARSILAVSDLLAHTSLSEGGANSIMEAIASDVPVVSTRIDGSVGILGDDYPGYCPVGDAPALADVLRRAEVEPAFHQELRQHCRALLPLTDPQRERESWQAILKDVCK